jgi:hypothetical protein
MREFWRVVTGDVRPTVEECYDTFPRVLHMLKTPHFVKGIKVSELDLMFGNHTEPLTTTNFGIVFQWLMVISAWKMNIKDMDDWLQRLSNGALSKPSLKTFRPIPTLRQHITDLRNAIEREKDDITDEARAVFSELRGVTDHQLESLDGILETLIKEADVLSTEASNEIQLVIGSVAIQVSSPIGVIYNHNSDSAYRTLTR